MKKQKIISTQIRQIFLPVSYFFWGLCFLWQTACDSQTSSSTSGASLKNVAQTATVSSGSPSTLAITDGSASGTSVNIPQGALPEGSQLTLDRVSSPTNFSGLTDSSGQSLSSASSAVSLSAKDSSGNSINKLSAPMTLQIPYTGGSGLVTIEQKVENLCLFMESPLGSFIWRKSDLTVDTTASKVTMSTIYLGTYQLFYCGSKDNFTTEKLEEAADQSDVVSNVLSLSVDLAKYKHNATHFCSLLLDQQGTTEQPTFFVLEAKDMEISSSATSLSIVLDRSKVTDSQTILVAIAGQTASQSCPTTTGSNLDVNNFKYDRAISFRFSGSNFKAQGAARVLGESPYLIKQAKITVGLPSSLSSISQDTSGLSNQELCIRVPGDYSLGNFEASDNLANNGLFKNSQNNVTFDVGVSTATDVPEINYQFGALCDGNDDSYTTTSLGKKEIDGSYHLFPTKLALSVVSSDIKTAFQTHLGISIDNVCLQVFDGNCLSSISAPNDTSGTTSCKALVKTEGSLGTDLQFYLPVDDTKKDSSGVPLYDVQISEKGSSGCLGSASGKPIQLNDLALSNSLMPSTTDLATLVSSLAP